MVLSIARSHLYKKITSSVLPNIARPHFINDLNKVFHGNKNTPPWIRMQQHLSSYVPPFLRGLTVCDLKVFPNSFIEVNLNLKELIAETRYCTDSSGLLLKWASIVSDSWASHILLASASRPVKVPTKSHRNDKNSVAHWTSSFHRTKADTLGKWADGAFRPSPIMF